MPANIFHDYDIRGKYPGEINENVFGRLAWAIKQVLKPKKIALARDGRASGRSLFGYLAGGLDGLGVKVIDLGQASTPFCFWYSQKYRVDALMITASHNPAEENGLKIYSARRGAVDRQSGLARIQRKYESAPANLKILAPRSLGEAGAGLKHKNIRNATAFLEFPSLGHHENKFRAALLGNIKRTDARAEYQKFVLGRVKKISPRLARLSPKIKLAVDFLGGVAAPEIISVLEAIGLNFSTLNENIGGGRSPNPLEEANQRAARALVKSKRADLAAIIDGDGDRVVFLNEKGEAIDPNFIACLMIERGLAEKKGDIIKTVSMGRIVDEVARAQGYKVHTVKVGRSHVGRAAKKKQAWLGVEKSGHYFFKDFFYGDSALWAILRVLEILSKSKEPLSRLTKPYQKYAVTPEINLPFKGRVDYVMKTLKEKFKDGEISELDGLKIDYPDWGFSLRKSNTEPVWRLALEGLNQADVEERRKELETIVSKE